MSSFGHEWVAYHVMQYMTNGGQVVGRQFAKSIGVRKSIEMLNNLSYYKIENYKACLELIYSQFNYKHS